MLNNNTFLGYRARTIYAELDKRGPFNAVPSTASAFADEVIV